MIEQKLWKYTLNNVIGSHYFLSTAERLKNNLTCRWENLQTFGTRPKEFN